MRFRGFWVATNIKVLQEFDSIFFEQATSRGVAVPATGRATRSTRVLVYRKNTSIAPKLIICAAINHTLEPQERECPSTHDAGLTCHVERAR